MIEISDNNVACATDANRPVARIARQLRWMWIWNENGWGGVASSYDFEITQAIIWAGYPTELWVRAGSAWETGYDATLDLHYITNPWDSEDIIEIDQTGAGGLDISLASECVVQFYFDTAVCSISAGFLQSSYGWEVAVTQSNREWRIYGRRDTRQINWLDSVDSTAILPVLAVDTLYEIRIGATGSVSWLFDIREVGGDWLQWSERTWPDTARWSTAPSKYAFGSWKLYWTAWNLRITSIWINEIASS